MSIDREEVERIAQLARIDLEDEEIESLQSEIGEILEYVEKLEELETEEVEPTTQPILERMEGRGDEVESGLSRDEVLQNAPDADEGQFRVPKIVDD